MSQANRIGQGASHYRRNKGPDPFVIAVPGALSNPQTVLFPTPALHPQHSYETAAALLPLCSLYCDYPYMLQASQM